MSESGAPPISFPSPLGGVPLPADFAPCVLFATLFAAISCVGLWRMARKRTRCIFVALTLLFTIERTVLFALRAHAIKAPPQDIRVYLTLTAYWQGTLASGYGALFARLLAALKGLVLAALKPPADPEAPSEASASSQMRAVVAPESPTSSAPLLLGQTSSATSGARSLLGTTYSGTSAAPSLLDLTSGTSGAPSLLSDAPSGASAAPLLSRHTYSVVNSGESAPPDGRAAALALFRWLFRICELLSLVPFVLGLLIGYQFVVAVYKPGHVTTVQMMRFLIALVALVLLLALLQLCYWERRLTRTAAPLLVAALTVVVMIIPIYHLCIMDRMTTSLTSTAPHSGNTPAEKAIFYIFQVCPEFLVSGILLCINVRNVFGV